MSFVLMVILLLAAMWLLQGVGTFFQMRHYREVLGGITDAGGDGYVGTGNAKGRFGKGVIVIVVSDKSGTVTKALRMRGRTVFVRFEDATDLVGMEIEDLEAKGLKEPYDVQTMLAAKNAVEQIRKIESEQREKEVQVA